MRVQVTKKIAARALKRAVHDKVADAIGDVTENLLEEANRRVPIEEGTLARSGFAEVNRPALAGQVAYDTPYAIRQHEDPTLRHDEGRTDHWLEDTARARQDDYTRYVRDALERAARRA